VRYLEVTAATGQMMRQFRAKAIGNVTIYARFRCLIISIVTEMTNASYELKTLFSFLHPETLQLIN
jgi:hypothetical protein